MAEEDGGVYPRQDPSAVNLSTEAVASHAEGGAGPVKSTSVDVFKRNTPGNQSRENGASERGGEAGSRNQSSGPSPLHPQAYPGRLGKKLQQDPKSEKRHSESAGTNRTDKGAILPKFGEWDVSDPASGEGYTVIFDKARDEKKTGGAARIPTVGDSAPPVKPGMDSQKMQGSSQESSCMNWLCCCFHPHGMK